jgi:hypothetical protein
MIGNVVFTLTAAGALVAGLLTRRIFLALLAGWLLMAELTRGRQTRPVAPIPPMTFDRPDHLPDGEAEAANETTPLETEAEPEPEPGPRPEPEPER